MDKKEIIKRREAIFDGCLSKSVIKKGSRNIHKEIRCCICDKPLVRYIPYDKSYVVLNKMYYLNVLGFNFGMCRYVLSCCNYINKKDNNITK